jgi:hypothetical protein
MTGWINEACWWTGALFLSASGSCGVVFGFSFVVLWMADKAAKKAGQFELLVAVAFRIMREQRAARGLEDRNSAR